MVSSNRYKIKVQRNITLEVAVKIWSRAFIQPFIAKTTFQMTRQKKKWKILETELCFTFEFMILSHDGIRDYRTAKPCDNPFIGPEGR